MKNSNRIKAPICLFTFNRLEETVKTIEALKNNFLAKDCDLKIFSDGPRSFQEKENIQKVRNYLKTVNGFKSIELFESDTNMGLANSIITGVSNILKSHNSVVVLEDDLITSPNFLDFMQQALDYYEEDDSVISISGFTMNLPSLSNKKDFYFGYRASSWGWGTWKKDWQRIDWKISDYENFIKDRKAKIEFKRGGSDLVRMLQNQMKGKIDSWAIRFCYNQFKKKQKTVFPTISKISNIGFGENATHTAGAIRFKTTLDVYCKRTFRFEKYKEMDSKLVREFAKKFSTKTIFLEKAVKLFKK